MVDTQLKTLIDKLYGSSRRRIQHLKNGIGEIPNIMGTAPRNHRELDLIKSNGYDSVRSLEADSHRIGADDIGFPADAIKHAKRDIEDIKHSWTDLSSGNAEKFIQADQDRIKKDQDLPQDELVMISNADDSRIVDRATPADVEYIYHNTHNSEREINQRHPQKLFYTYRDAEIDAKKDL